MKMQSTGKLETTYYAYLLRIWLEPDQDRPPDNSWRFSLEDAHAGTRRGFRDLGSLLVYLHDLTSPHPGTASPGE